MKKRKNKILIVDDDPGILKLTEMILKENYSNLNTASCGIECVNKIINNKPDLVILDVMMPEQDGYTTCRKIREIKGGDDVIVILHTAIPEEEVKKEYEKAGADGYLLKGMDPEEFSNEVTGYLTDKNLQKVHF